MILPTIDVPSLPTKRLPEAERQDVLFLSRKFNDMVKYTKNFYADVGLFEECLFAARKATRENRDLLSRYPFVAARDGAMTIYHFAKALDNANGAAFRVPTIARLVDKNLLKDARKLLEDTFPLHVALRHAVAHAAELASNPEKEKDRALSGPYEGLGIKIEHEQATATIEEGLSNRTFFTTHQGQILSYDITKSSADALVEATRTFMSAFSRVSAHLRE
ncbi:hypothetical protein [Henriciella aquimarina]|uniref:hypothetical protein n=1 Tax=Henriciella aquimarina TaxID=545261 RepID=UPI00117A5EA1|nr:hypothetical protein [Henriciella aquimarina]